MLLNLLVDQYQLTKLFSHFLHPFSILASKKTNLLFKMSLLLYSYKKYQAGMWEHVKHILPYYKMNTIGMYFYKKCVILYFPKKVKFLIL